MVPSTVSTSNISCKLFLTVFNPDYTVSDLVSMIATYV